MKSISKSPKSLAQMAAEHKAGMKEIHARRRENNAHFKRHQALAWESINAMNAIQASLRQGEK